MFLLGADGTAQDFVLLVRPETARPASGILTTDASGVSAAQVILLADTTLEMDAKNEIVFVVRGECERRFWASERVLRLSAG
jgi:hypothetical protein